MMKGYIVGYLRREWRRDRVRWIGLVLALVGGIGGVSAGFDGYFVVAGVCLGGFCVGLYFMDRR